jgi:hypothetical protein
MTKALPALKRGKLYTAMQCAEALGISRSRMYAICARGEIAVMRSDRGRIEGVFERDVEDWIARHRVPVGEPTRPRLEDRPIADVDQEMRRLIRQMQ